MKGFSVDESLDLEIIRSYLSDVGRRLQAGHILRVSLRFRYTRRPETECETISIEIHTDYLAKLIK